MAYSDKSHSRIQPCLESGAMATRNQEPSPYISQFTDSGVSVIDQAPESRIQLQFPIYFSKKGVLSVSIIKCVVGSIQLILGIINIFNVPHWTSEIAAPIWCGFLVRYYSLPHIGIRCLHFAPIYLTGRDAPICRNND